jgi:hypothetical protein
VLTTEFIADVERLLTLGGGGGGADCVDCCEGACDSVDGPL